VIEKRVEQEREEASGRNGAVVAAETLRSATESSAEKSTDKKKDDEHMSVFWRVFGGTILSIVALAAITLYNSLSSGITDLRNELNREREARAGLVKKEDSDTRTKSIYDRIRGLEGYKADIDTTRERVAANATAIDGVRKDNAAALEGVKKDAAAALDAVKKDATAALESVRKDAAGLDVLKERVALLEAVKKDVAMLEVVKEKLASATADLKTVRDELQKVQQELERNKASDLERKTSRDLQAKQAEEALKELQKGLQDCREKLARLEGAQPVVGPPAPKAKGATTSKDD
jgi:DNA repair exonuclease SbcCD ATPase subunit